MAVYKYDLAEEFPELHDSIHRLKESDAHFRRLYDEYDSARHEIIRIEQEIDTVSDEVAENVKKKRLKLKDELYALLKKNEA